MHFRQVVGNDEEHRGAEAGGDGLADVDIAGNDHAVDRRGNRATGQVHLGLFQSAVIDFHGGLGLMQIGQGFVEIGLGDQILCAECFGAIRVDLRQFERGLGRRQTAFRLDQGGFIGGRINSINDLPLLYR